MLALLVLLKITWISHYQSFQNCHRILCQEHLIANGTSQFNKKSGKFMKTVSMNLSFNCVLCLACKFWTYNILSNKCLLKWAIYWWLLFPLGLSSNIIKKYRSFEIYNSLLIIFSVILVIQYNKILKTHVNLSTFLLFNIRNILCLYDLQKKKFKFKRKFPNISNWNKPLLIKTFSDNYTYFFLGNRIKPQPAKLLIFLRFLRLKVV